jgi:hypothetical protein
LSCPLSSTAKSWKSGKLARLALDESLDQAQLSSIGTAWNANAIKA